MKRSRIILAGFVTSAAIIWQVSPHISSHVGFLAAACTTASFIPQVIHTWRTKDTSGISLKMYLLFVFGVMCWFIYGLRIGDIPMYTANAATLILAGIVLTLKLQEPKQQQTFPSAPESSENPTPRKTDRAA